MPARNSHEEIPTRVSAAIEASIKEATEVRLSIPPELDPERSDPLYPISPRFLTLLPVGVDHTGSVGPYPRFLDTGCDYAAVGSVAARRAS